jgi:hypothetical protein
MLWEEWVSSEFSECTGPFSPFSNQCAVLSDRAFSGPCSLWMMCWAVWQSMVPLSAGKVLGVPLWVFQSRLFLRVGSESQLVWISRSLKWSHEWLRCELWPVPPTHWEAWELELSCLVQCFSLRRLLVSAANSFSKVGECVVIFSRFAGWAASLPPCRPEAFPLVLRPPALFRRGTICSQAALDYVCSSTEKMGWHARLEEL